MFFNTRLAAVAFVLTLSTSWRGRKRARPAGSGSVYPRVGPPDRRYRQKLSLKSLKIKAITPTQRFHCAPRPFAFSSFGPALPSLVYV